MTIKKHDVVNNWKPSNPSNALASLADEINQNLDVLQAQISSLSGGVGKGFASGYVDAGQFVTLDNLKFTVTTSGLRGLSCATVTGTVNLSISGTFGYINGPGGAATGYPGPQYTTTPSGSWFGWSFPNAGDGSTYLVNDYTNQRFYRVTLMIGAGYLKNFISIERLV
jgi:hypothetical protein